MKIILDAFGGDHAPLEVLKGAAMALADLPVEILLCGDRDKILQCARRHGIDISAMDIIHAPDVITMEEDPGSILKSKSNSSMAEGMRRLVAGEGDAFVSAGSTGALVVGSTFIVRRIKGIKRAVLGAMLPTAAQTPYLLVDTGANVECRPEFLYQFGVMGSIYMHRAMGIKVPSVGLLNIGTEESKGGELQKESYALLKEAPIRFIGNVEARDIPAGVCDVLVTDGFSGNVVLKLTEGLGLTFSAFVKDIFKKNLLTKLSAAFCMQGLKAFKKRLDYSEYGGAPLLGFSKPVIKAHGSSNATAIKNAIRQADDFAKSGVIAEIQRHMSLHRE